MLVCDLVFLRGQLVAECCLDGKPYCAGDLVMENAVLQTGIAILTNDYGKECGSEKANNNML